KAKKILVPAGKLLVPTLPRGNAYPSKSIHKVATKINDLNTPDFFDFNDIAKQLCTLRIKPIHSHAGAWEREAMRNIESRLQIVMQIESRCEDSSRQAAFEQHSTQGN